MLPLQVILEHLLVVTPELPHDRVTPAPHHPVILEHHHNKVVATLELHHNSKEATPEPHLNSTEVLLLLEVMVEATEVDMVVVLVILDSLGVGV